MNTGLYLAQNTQKNGPNRSMLVLIIFINEQFTTRIEHGREKTNGTDQKTV